MTVSFIELEHSLGRLFEQLQLVADNLLTNGKEERVLAIAQGDFHNGVPAIILDGGWSKRSHKHSYNAKSGVGVIFGELLRNHFSSA